MGSIDGIYGVVDGGVHDRKAAGWVHGCRLRTRSANDHEKGSVPLYNRVDRLSRGVLGILMLIVKGSAKRAVCPHRKSRTNQHQGDQVFCHQGYSTLFLS